MRCGLRPRNKKDEGERAGSGREVGGERHFGLAERLTFGQRCVYFCGGLFEAGSR